MTEEKEEKENRIYVQHVLHFVISPEIIAWDTIGYIYYFGAEMLPFDLFFKKIREGEIGKFVFYKGSSADFGAKFPDGTWHYIEPRNDGIYYAQSKTDAEGNCLWAKDWPSKCPEAISEATLIDFVEQDLNKILK